MKGALQSLLATLDLNTRLFLNALEGVDDVLATSRPNGSTNHMAFVACHLVEARHYLAGVAGLETKSPFEDLLREAKGIEDVSTFPSVTEIRAAWQRVSEKLHRHFEKMNESGLERRTSHSFPIAQGETLGGALTFLLQHDGFHVGQLALLRKYHGLDAMRYGTD